MPVTQADLEALAFQQDLALHAHHSFQSGYKPPQDKSYRNRLVCFFLNVFVFKILHHVYLYSNTECD